MLTKDQIAAAIPVLAKRRGWTEEQAREKLDEFMAIKAVIDFFSEQTTVDAVRARLQREANSSAYAGAWQGRGY